MRLKYSEIIRNQPTINITETKNVLNVIISLIFNEINYDDIGLIKLINYETSEYFNF